MRDAPLPRVRRLAADELALVLREREPEGLAAATERSDTEAVAPAQAAVVA